MLLSAFIKTHYLFITCMDFTLHVIIFYMAIIQQILFNNEYLLLLQYQFFFQGETISGIKVFWYNDLKKVPKEFSWYIAHEFFDVMPIHKFEVRVYF